MIVIISFKDYLKIFQMNVDPEDLIPKVPKPRDLQPFPTTQSIVSVNKCASKLVNKYTN